MIEFDLCAFLGRNRRLEIKINLHSSLKVDFGDQGWHRPSSPIRHIAMKSTPRLVESGQSKIKCSVVSYWEVHAHEGWTFD